MSKVGEDLIESMKEAAAIARGEQQAARIHIQGRAYVPEEWAMELEARVKRLEAACANANEEICQTLGQALGYPRYCDDQKNFPGTTEAEGVCVGDHGAESLATEAATRITKLEIEVAQLQERLDQW